MNAIVAVAIGGGAGAVLRYLFSVMMVPIWGTAFPYSTLAINIIGSCIIGFVARWVPIESNTLRLFIMTGILGGFTTFSAFSLETLKLWANGQKLEAGTYCLLSIVLCLVGVFLGDWLANYLSR